MSDLTSPIATYDLPSNCYSGIIAERCLFLGVKDGNSNYIIVYEISTSVTEPLIKLYRIQARSDIFKMMNVGQ
jgi:hypothetical protein